MRPKLIALFAVSAVALAGCSAGEPSIEPTATVTSMSTSPEASESKLIDESQVTAKALTIESADASSSPSTESDIQNAKPYEEQRQEFLSFIDPEFSGWTGELPTEVELLSAAKLVCKELEKGTELGKVEVIKDSIYKFTKEQQEKLTLDQKSALLNTPLFENNRRLVTAAASAFCLEHTY